MHSDSMNFPTLLYNHPALEKVNYLPGNFLCLTHSVNTGEQRKNYLRNHPLMVIHRIQGPNCPKLALHLVESQGRHIAKIRINSGSGTGELSFIITGLKFTIFAFYSVK